MEQPNSSSFSHGSIYSDCESCFGTNHNFFSPSLASQNVANFAVVVERVVGPDGRVRRRRRQRHLPHPGDERVARARQVYS